MKFAAGQGKTAKFWAVRPRGGPPEKAPTPNARPAPTPTREISTHTHTRNQHPHPHAKSAPTPTQQRNTHNTTHNTHTTQHTTHNTQHTTHNTQHTTQHTHRLFMSCAPKLPKLELARLDLAQVDHLPQSDWRKSSIFLGLGELPQELAGLPGQVRFK